MLIENKGKLLRSKPETFSDGAEIDIDLNFLKPALKRFEAPVVRQLIFHIRASGTGTTGGFAGEDAYKMIGRLRMKDEGGEFFNLPGSQIRIAEQMEVGDRQIDNATLASGSTDSSYDLFAKVHFDTGMAHRGADTALPLIHLTSGGEISVTFDTPSTFDIVAASTTLRVYAVVHDERVREAKARMVWREVSITNSEDDYLVKGSLRAAWISSDLPNAAGYTSLASITSLESNTFDFNDLDTELLRQEYLAKSVTRASDDEFLASTPNAIPIVTPSKGQHIGKMMDLDSFHMDIGSVPTSGKMVTCVIRDRNANLAAEWLGYATTNDYVRALKKTGHVVTKGGKGKHVLEWDAKLVRRLPVRIH